MADDSICAEIAPFSRPLSKMVMCVAGRYLTADFDIRLWILGIQSGTMRKFSTATQQYHAVGIRFIIKDKNCPLHKC